MLSFDLDNFKPFPSLDNALVGIIFGESWYGTFNGK